ncbi:mitochondrial carrier domain-containing protein [Pelagophyceae sp. CCMP2097]|nr:mitochondrial carrier domain-containing protein [Pelagophyceae sp. CCMP2097]
MAQSRGYQRMGPMDNALVGVAAGTIEVTMLQPILYWKNAAQQNMPFTLNPKFLYRGLSTSIVNMSVLTGLQFPLTGMVTNAITAGTPRKLTANETIFAALTGGTLSGIACGPMELVMIQQQRFGGSIFSTPARIVSECGIGGLGRGLSMSMGREGCYTAGVLGVCPVLTEALEERGIGGGAGKMLAAIGAGVLAATLSHPLDTVKSCLQGDVARLEYTTTLEAFSALYAKAGWTRFFSGWHWRTGRMILAVGIMNECKSTLSPLFFPKHFADDQ